MADWIKLHRKSLDSRVFSDPILWRLWCWCLIKSNWKRGWYCGCELQPGQFATGREAASEELGVSGSAWYRSMQKLQEFGCIRMEANNRFTIVSIVNWRKYQGEVNNERTTDEQQADNERTTGEQQADTIEEGQELKEGKNEKKETHTHARDAIIFPKQLDNQEFRETWCVWEQHLNEQFKPLTPSVAQVQLMELDRFGLAEAKEIVLFSISKSAKSLLTNGDHKRRGAGAQYSQKRKTPGMEGII